MDTIVLSVEPKRRGAGASRVASSLWVRLGGRLVLVKGGGRSGADHSERLIDAAVHHDAELIIAPAPRRDVDLVSGLAGVAPCPVVFSPRRVGREWPPPGGLACLLDGSEESLVAACVAGDLAMRLNCPLTVIEEVVDHQAVAPEAREMLAAVLSRCRSVKAVCATSLAEDGLASAGIEPLELLVVGFGARDGRWRAPVSRQPPPLLTVPPVAHIGVGSGHYEVQSVRA